jgi:hypothetical protein
MHVFISHNYDFRNTDKKKENEKEERKQKRQTETKEEPYVNARPLVDT